MSAYRSAGTRGLPTCLVLCSSCATRARLEGDQATFTCDGCSLEQPVGPIELGELRQCEIIASKAASYTQLDAFARAYGGLPSAIAHTTRCDGLECTVGLAIDSGNVRGIELSAETPSFPPIRLTAESAAEKDAKALGSAREVQTGDAEFDDAVFIDTDAADDDVLVVLGAPAVRAAIRALLQGFESLKLGPDGVTVTKEREGTRSFEPAELWRLLGALRRLAGAPRPLVVTRVPMPLRTRLGLGFAFLMGSGLPLWGFAGGTQIPLLNPAVLLGPALVGLVVAAVAWAIMPTCFGGRSSSHRELRMARLGSLFAPCFMIGVFMVANRATASERTDTIVVQSVTYDEEQRQSEVSTVTASEEFGIVTARFPDEKRQARAGQRILVHYATGRFGLRWKSRAPDLDVGGGVLLVAFE